jgi:hypothetical protein
MSDLDQLPPVIQAWLRQLLDPDLLQLIERATSDHQVEVRLYANMGRVRKRATLIMDGGPQEMNMVPPLRGAFRDETFVDPEEVAAVQ